MTDVVLVHGFWADGSSWSGVIPTLLDAGHRVTAVQLPLSSQDDDVAATRRALDRHAGPVVLVGHSYGGVVISRAGAKPSAGAPKVGALVYVSAYGPDADEDVQELASRFPDAPGGAAIRPTDDGHLWLDVDAFPAAFAADVDPAVARVMATTQGPASVTCLTPLSEAPAWRSLPSWYVVSSNDQVIAPDMQRFMAERMGATTTEVAGSHAALVSHPGAVAQVVLDAAASFTPSTATR